MALRDILVLPDPRLRLLCDRVKTIDAETRKLVEDMFETMRAPRVLDWRRSRWACPTRCHPRPRQEGRAAAAAGLHQSGNHLALGGERLYEEGCLSIPEYYEEVERPARVKVKYLDLDGKPHEIEADGLLATCLQHEIDHLNGMLFIDHISKLKRDRVTKKFAKAAKLTGGKPVAKPHAASEKTRTHTV